MKVYVLGAGVSKTVGYPLGSELFDEVDLYVQGSGHCIDRFDYKNDWPALCRWLKENENPLIQEAYRTKQLEHLFTILDQAWMLKVSVMVDAVKQRDDEDERAWENYEETTKSYQEYREILLWALESYLQFKHHEDVTTSTDRWNYLRAFGQKLCKGDAIITFNYDSALERILLQQGKWSPRDGYGFELVFQTSDTDQTPVELEKSAISVLHLHGAVGWYARPRVKLGYQLPRGGGWLPPEARTPAPLDTPVSLDSEFLGDLGVGAVDACLPAPPPPDQRQILVHPSFFKDFELESHGGRTPFIRLWKKAAELLRKAEQVFVICYSLPAADSAALTLLLTNCDKDKVSIVNGDGAHNLRLSRLLSSTVDHPRSFEEWLKEIPDCEKWGIADL